MRKFKKIKRKEIIYDISEWTEIESRAATLSLKTTEYIRRMSLHGRINHFDMKEVAALNNSLRSIGNNINQIARKANEINSIYAEDIEKLRRENFEICHTLSRFLSELPSLAA